MAKEETGKLQKAIELLNKNMGGGTVYEYKNFTGSPVKRMRTGSIGLDVITGGGWVHGLMNYISGWESSGKSTACLYAIKECQKIGKKAVYIDHEYSFDKKYAESLGVNVDELILSQPDNIEQGYQILINLVETGEVGLVVFDSIAAAMTLKELEGDVGDASMGVKAKLNSTTFPKICMSAKKTDTVVLMVNQLREKIGVMFGSPVTEPGGNALKFWPSIKIETRQSTKAKGEGDEIIGNLIKAKCTKNKTYPPFKETEYSIVYGEGIDRIAEVVDIGTAFGVITRAGSWFSYDDTKLGQGRNNAIATLKDNPELVEEIEDLIYKMI